MRRIELCILVIILIICGCACNELEARDEAESGLKALKSCDFYGAQQHFARAYPVLKDHPEVALGFAFSTLFGVLDFPEFSNLLMRLGTTSNLRDFCLQQSNRSDHDTIVGGEDCLSSRSKSRNIKWPYPCPKTAGCDYLSHIDPTLLWGDIVDVLQQNRVALLKTAFMISNAANQMKTPLTMDNMMGFDSLTIHQADLFLLSAVIEILVFASDTASGYENRFSVVQTLDKENCRIWADFVNRYVGIASVSPNLSDSLQLFKTMMSDIELAFVHARLLRESYDNSEHSPCEGDWSLFKWVRVPYGVMDNIIALTSSFRQTPVVISDVFSPDIQIDLPALLRFLPTRTAEFPIVSCDGDEPVFFAGIYIYYLNQCISPPLFEPELDEFKLSDGISYRLSTGWQKWSVWDLL